MKVKNLIRSIIQTSYILVFFIATLSIAGNIELDQPIPRGLIILYIVSGLLSYGKVIYINKFSK